MCNRVSNTAFDTACLVAPTMDDMDASAERLYEAAKALKRVTGQSNVARLLNVSPQTVKNWEKRGVSSIGTFKAEELIGCSAYWLTTGEGEMAPAHALLVPYRDLDAFESQLITLFRQLTPSQRDDVLTEVNNLANMDRPGRSPQDPYSGKLPRSEQRPMLIEDIHRAHDRLIPWVPARDVKKATP